MSGSPKADRLRDARIRAGYGSAAEAAQRFGWPEAAYRHHENATRNYGPDAAKKYGRAFKVKPGWLLGLEADRELPPGAFADTDHLVVNGSVVAGVWHESEHWDDERQFVLNLASPVPGAKRFGLVVEGYSMDRAYEPGTVLDCISIFADGVKPGNGDHVIVERIRPDGLRELTVKEYREEIEGDERRFLLVPRSTRPEFRPIEYPGPDKPGQSIDGEIVQVVAFVVAAYPPRVIELFRRMGLIGDAKRAEARRA